MPGPPPFVVSRPHRKPDKNPAVLWVIGGVVAAVVLIAGTMLAVDELRIWNVKRHIRQELSMPPAKEIEFRQRNVTMLETQIVALRERMKGRTLTAEDNAAISNAQKVIQENKTRIAELKRKR